MIENLGLHLPPPAPHVLSKKKHIRIGKARMIRNPYTFILEIRAVIAMIGIRLSLIRALIGVCFAIYLVTIGL